jgi:predicted transposase/invertase (TIGR01784 family)
LDSKITTCLGLPIFTENKLKHKINPIVDCVFKAILGSEENKNLLIHFLNAILEPKEGYLIQKVTLKNPYNEKEFIGDKLTIVDVKAIDEQGKKYQIEIQLVIHAALAERILYTWSSIYHSQIQEGDNYQKLKPVISIWLLNGNLFEELEEYHLPFSVYNEKHKIALTEHLAIHLIQLPKWQKTETITNEKERWLYLFKEGKNVDIDKPPQPLVTQEMEQAMKVLHRFSENETNYLLYQSRLDAILKENTYVTALEEAIKAKEQAIKGQKQAIKIQEKTEKEKEKAVKEKQQIAKEKEKAVKEKQQAIKTQEQITKEKEQAQRKINELLLLLEKKGIDPDKELK